MVFLGCMLILSAAAQPMKRWSVGEWVGAIVGGEGSDRFRRLGRRSRALVGRAAWEPRVGGETRA